MPGLNVSFSRTVLFCMLNPMKATPGSNPLSGSHVANINKVCPHIFHLKLSGVNKHIN